MFVLKNMWFQTLMRQFFFNIDKIVYNFISTLYDLLISIARTSILSQADILDMAERVYELLAVFMIFKVTFSLIMYTVNPDDFSDKTKGVGKLGTNIIISLALLVLTPYVFNLAYRVQTIILEDNSLAALIFGEEVSNSKKNPINTAGDTMAFVVMSPFFSPNTSIPQLFECVDLTSGGVFNQECSGLEMLEGSTLEPLGDKDSLYALTRKDPADLESGENGDFELQTLKNYVVGVTEGNLGLMFRQDMAIASSSTEDEEYIIDYKYVFSTVLGVVVILLLLTFCMDVALRSVKLAFLQLIAPIPIISFVDPKSGKDGMFKQWYQMCFKTYISLFVRLLALYFVVYIVSRLNTMTDIIDGSYVTNLYIKIFVIIGALMFAKQLPKILEGLGIKLDGDGKFTLNPFKKFTDEAFGGKQILGAGAAGLAGAAALGANGLSAFQNFKNSKGTGFWNRAKTATRGLGSVFAGGISATARGLYGASKGEAFGKNFTNSYSGAMQAKQSRSDRIANDVGFGEMMGSKFTQAIGGHTKGEMVKTATDTAKKIQDVYNSMMNAAIGNDKEKFTTNIAGVDREFAGIKGLSQYMEEVKKTSIDREKYSTQEAYLDALQEQNDLIDSLENAKKDRLNDIASGHASTQDIATTTAIREGYKQMQGLADDLNKTTTIIDSNIATIDSTLDAKSINGSAKGVSNQITASTKASHSVTVDQYAAKKGQK